MKTDKIYVAKVDSETPRMRRNRIAAAIVQTLRVDEALRADVAIQLNVEPDMLDYDKRVHADTLADDSNFEEA